MTSNNKKRICLISYSVIADDPRVRRQGDAFHDAGWTVTAVGLAGAKSEPPEWSILSCGEARRNIQPETNAMDALGETDEHSNGSAVAESEGLNSLDATDGTGGKAYEGVASESLEVSSGAVPVRHGLRLQLNVLAKKILGSGRAYRVFAWLFWRFFSIGMWGLNSIKRVAYIVRHEPVRLLFAIFAAIQRLLGKMSSLVRRLFGSPKYILARDTLLVWFGRFWPHRIIRMQLNVRELKEVYEYARTVKADVYLANDWLALPMAFQAARDNGGILGYDTHEYALEEYKYRLSWRLFRRPLVKQIERLGLKTAKVRTAVSQGIAEGMARDYGLDEPLTPIRNIPVAHDVFFRPCGQTINVLFHGILAPDRGLEDCIRSVPMWRPEFRLLFRGPGSAEFVKKLESIIVECNVSHRVDILPPVPMLDMIREAALIGDIGISTPPKTSNHNVYALPNKFFEYIQAGLAICVADLPDMSRIVKEHDLGLLIDEVTPEDIATAINQFTFDKVNEYKMNSLKAAKELCWEVEQKRLVALYDAALAARV